MTNDASSNSTDVAARYENRTFQKLSSDASANTTDIDARYENRSYRKLASSASTNSIDVPAEYNTVSRRELVKAGGFTEWREVVCGDDITADLVRRVQSALISRGYDVGNAGADNVLGAATKAALVKFQRDNGLPVGQMDFETLKALGVRR